MIKYILIYTQKQKNRNIVRFFCFKMMITYFLAIL